MKKLAFVGALLLACSGQDLEQPFDGFYEPPEREEELGTLEQALSWSNGFGNLGAGSECQAPWFDDYICYLPARETWNVRWDCTGCTTLQQQAVNSAKTTFRTRMLSIGVTINWVSSGYHVFINKAACSSGGSSCLGEGQPSGFDDLYWMPGTFSLAQEYRSYNMKLNFDAVDVSGLTDAQKRMSYTNLALHELGHFVGLGHTVAGTCMEVTGTQVNAFTLCIYNSTQFNRLAAWDPNTDD